MSRFSKSEAESRGWKFVHSVEADEVLTSGTQGEYRKTAESHVAEKYQSVEGGPSQIIHEEGETMGKLLERIALYEARMDSYVRPDQGVEVTPNALNVDEAGLPLRTVSVPVDPEDISEDKAVMQITEEEWAARDKADVLVVMKDGEAVQVSSAGSTPDVTDAYDLKLLHDAAVENARTAGEEVETEILDLDPALVEVDSPGATGTGSLVVRAGEKDMGEVFARKQEGKVEKENARVAEQSVIGPQGVAPEGEEDLVGTDVAHAADTDLESEQPRMTQGEFDAQKDALEHPEDVVAPGATAEAQSEAQDAQSEAVEEKAKEARDEDLATADDAEHVAEAREAGIEAAAESTERPEVEATPAAEALAEEKGVDLAEVEGTGKDGRVTKPDVEKAAE